MKKLRIAQYGCGKMSAYTMRYAIEKGAEIVCAFGRSSNIGKDIGEIAGLGKTGVVVHDSKDAVAILRETRPDACITKFSSLFLKIPFQPLGSQSILTTVLNIALAVQHAPNAKDNTWNHCFTLGSVRLRDLHDGAAIARGIDCI